jgi:predicted secreted protein
MGVNPTSTSTVSFGGTPIGGLANITFALNRTPIDITELGNTFKKYLPGQSDGTATVEVFYDQAVHTLIEGALNAATASTAVVYTAHTGATFTFNAIVNDMSFSSPVNDVVKATITLQVISAVTIA